LIKEPTAKRFGSRVSVRCVATLNMVKLFPTGAVVHVPTERGTPAAAAA
jgi:hypothetical protein